MDIQNFSGFNIEGLCKVEFCYSYVVKKITSPDADHQVTVELKPPFVFHEIGFTKTDTSIDIRQVEDESGTWYGVKVDLVNPKLMPQKSANFAWLEQKDLIVILTDNNGYQLLIGSIRKPARLGYYMTNPATGRNQRTVHIEAVHDIEPYFVKETIVSTEGAFSNGFSNGFNN